MAGGLAEIWRRWRGPSVSPALRAAPLPVLLQGLPGVSWAWRPALWSGEAVFLPEAETKGQVALCDQVTLFHNGPWKNLVLTSLPSAMHFEARQGLGLNLRAFQADYLSLVVNLSEADLSRLSEDQVLRATLCLEASGPVAVYTRLNLRFGPEVETVAYEAQVVDGRLDVDFDLFYQRLPGRRVDGAWLDLVIKSAPTEQIALRDLLLSQRCRAQF